MGETAEEAITRSAWLAGFADIDRERRGICGDCQGSGYDRASRKGDRHSRTCQRCRGQGSTAHGKVRR